MIFFRNIVDAKEIDTSVSDLHFPFEMQSVGINDKDGSGIRRIVGKKTGNCDLLGIGIVSHAVSMFIIGFCHAESIAVLFYGIAVDICGVSVEGNQSVRIRAFF